MDHRTPSRFHWNRITEISMREALVIGMGVSGRAAKRYLERRGWQVTAVDRNLAEGVLSDTVDLDADRFELCVLSPGVDPTHRLARGKIVGEVALALSEFKGRAIGITGTNGKTTVALMVAHILNAAGVPARAVGNVGVPLTDAVDACGDEILVCELSSYQLETLNGPYFEAGAILNITPDHLDRYETPEAYADAKWNLHGCLKGGAPLFVPSHLARPGTISFGWEPTADIRVEENQVIRREKIETFLPLAYRGKCHHHARNWLAAYTLCRHLGVNPELICQGAATFCAPAHRMETVRELQGVTWVNDSKGTNVDAVRVAVESLEGPIRLIAGGRDKGSPFAEWLQPFAGRVTEVYAIGEAADALEAALGAVLPVHRVDRLEAAVKAAAEVAKVGDWVLLSPGCASFDQFLNFEKRGERFKELVEALPEGTKS